MGDKENPVTASEHDVKDGATKPEGGEAPADDVGPEPVERRWRRWHTLSGGLVLGAFLVEHLLTNAAALGGHATYVAVVGSILRISPVRRSP